MCLTHSSIFPIHYIKHTQSLLFISNNLYTCTAHNIHNGITQHCVTLRHAFSRAFCLVEQCYSSAFLVYTLELSAKAANHEPFMMFGIGKDFIVVAKSKEGYTLHTFVPSADSIGAYTHTEETLADPRCDEVFNTPIVFNHKQVQNCKCQEHYDSNDMYFYISNTHGEMYGICFPIGYTNNGKDKHAHFMLDDKIFGFALGLWLGKTNTKKAQDQ